MMYICDLALKALDKNLQISVKKQEEKSFWLNNDSSSIIMHVNDIINNIYDV